MRPAFDATEGAWSTISEGSSGWRAGDQRDAACGRARPDGKAAGGSRGSALASANSSYIRVYGCARVGQYTVVSSRHALRSCLPASSARSDRARPWLCVVIGTSRCFASIVERDAIPLS